MQFVKVINNNNSNDDDDNDHIERHNSRFLQSPHCAMNCLICSGDHGAVVYKLCKSHHNDDDDDDDDEDDAAAPAATAG